MPDNRFENQTALITGSSQGIGRGIALALAREGADIVINYHSDDGPAERTAGEIRELGRKVLVVQADVGRREEVRRMFEEAEVSFPRLDIVVANAAYSARGSVLEIEWEDVLRTLQVSQFGVFHTCQFAARRMSAQEPISGSRGKIILISSILAEVHPPGNAAYNMAKAAVNALGETLAAELAGHRINVNTINPGLIDTPGERKYASEEELQAAASRIPWKRLGTIDDIGRAAAYLASSDANYITGSTLRVDGGFLVGLELPPADQ